jgi:hypothetical protein
LETSGLPLWALVLIALLSGGVGVAIVKAVIVVYRDRSQRHSRAALQTARESADQRRHLRESLLRVMSVAQNPERVGVVEGINWPNELSGADYVISYTVGLGMPKEFVEGDRTLRRLIEAWQHRAASIADLEAITDLGERRRRLLEDDTFQYFAQWAARADKEFQALCLIECNLIGSGQGQPRLLSRTWRHRRDMLRNVSRLTRELELMLARLADGQS